MINYIWVEIYFLYDYRVDLMISNRGLLTDWELMVVINKSCTPKLEMVELPQPHSNWIMGLTKLSCYLNLFTIRTNHLFLNYFVVPPTITVTLKNKEYYYFLLICFTQTNSRDYRNDIAFNKLLFHTPN